MNKSDLDVFLSKHNFISCPQYSIPDEGMSSKVDAYVNGRVQLRIVLDRGQSFIDLATLGSNNWIDVFTLASRSDPAFQVKTGSFSEAIQTLASYWQKIINQLQ
jgi:hypothetical protein